MSGPTVVLVAVPPEPSLLLMSAAALMAGQTVYRAVQAVAASEAQAVALHERHTQDRQDHAQRWREADAQHLQALQAEYQAACQQWTRLCEVADAVGCSSPVSRPPDPAAGAPASVWAAHVRALQTLTHAWAHRIAQHGAASSEDAAPLALLEAFEHPAQADLATALAAYAQRQSPELLAAVQRVLARVAHLAWPPALQALVQELALPLSPERAQALLVELRRQVQLLQEADIARAQAVVLAHTLKELGYELEDVGETLFVEGGVLHFGKPGWGDYLVRLRFDAQRRTANFNVIRAVNEGENERSVLDHLAEDRWCAEFPTLLAALEARGMPLQVVRRLSAGELPVQRVLRDRLPAWVRASEAADEAEGARAAPLQRPLN
ncbi:MAG: hypothetical protein RLZZ494_1417 [Pseudomonadota bacterium]|jgi:hypothetical protein